MNESPESPFVTLKQAKDDRFAYRATPRTNGGTTARWNTRDYNVTLAGSAAGTGESPFESMAKVTGDFDRFADTTQKRAGNWKREHYVVSSKASGDATTLSPNSPFKDKGVDHRFGHIKKRLGNGDGGQGSQFGDDWNEVHYRAFKVAAAPSGMSADRSPFKTAKKGAKDERFVNARKTSGTWDVDHYKAFRLAPGAKGASGDKSPFANMMKETPRTAAKIQYSRTGRVGDFEMDAAQKSFMACKEAAEAVRKRCNGHGKAGAREAIFGDGKKSRK